MEYHNPTLRVLRILELIDAKLPKQMFSLT